MRERHAISTISGPTRVGSLGISALIAVAVTVSASLGGLYQAVLDAQGSGDWTSVRMVAQAIVQRVDRLQRRQAERPALGALALRLRSMDCGDASQAKGRGVGRQVGLDALSLASIDLPPPARG